MYVLKCGLILLQEWVGLKLTSGQTWDHKFICTYPPLDFTKAIFLLSLDPLPHLNVSKSTKDLRKLTSKAVATLKWELDLSEIRELFAIYRILIDRGRG